MDLFLWRSEAWLQAAVPSGQKENLSACPQSGKAAEFSAWARLPVSFQSLIEELDLFFLILFIYFISKT